MINLINFSCFDLASFAVFGVNSVTVSSIVFFKFESVSRDLVLLLTSFMADNACSHRDVVPKRHIKLWANLLSSGKFIFTR